MVDDPAPVPVDDTTVVVPISSGVVAVQLEDSDPSPDVVYVPGAGVDGITEAELEAALAPLSEQISVNTADIEYLKTTGGGTPTDPFVDWFQGDGEPPNVIPGAARGDMYYDRVGSRLYQLQ